MTMSMWSRGVFCLGFISGCYSAELDPDIPGVFVCETDRDCSAGLRCLAGVCDYSAQDQAGPELQIVSPGLLEAYAVGERSNIPLIVKGERLTLTTKASDDPEAGYLDVEVDGALVAAISEGDLSQGIDLTSLPLPSQPGLHHIRVIARNLNGEAFQGARSTVGTAFWIDDGKEHVGILEPAPGAKIPSGTGDALRIEVASLNFTFVNPGHVSPDAVDAAGEGYVHLYVDAELPNCLPACNFDYQSSIVPAGTSRVNRMIADSGIVLPDRVGTVRIQVVAQTNASEPYQRDAGTGDIVYHIVPVQSVIEVEHD